MIQQAWRALVDNPLSIERAFGTGTETLQLKADQAVKTRYAQSYQQDEFQASKEKEGLAVAWLATGGTLRGDSKKTNHSLAGELTFTLERPFVYKPNAPDVGRLGQELVKNHTAGLPLTAAKARELELGSKFTLKGFVSATGSRTTTNAQPVDVNGNAKLSAEATIVATGKDTVEATIVVGAEGALSASQSVTNGSTSLRATHERGRTVRVSIDLSTQRGQNAYAALLRLQGDAVEALAKSGEGVKLLASESPQSTVVSGSANRTGDAGEVRVDATVRNSTSSDGTRIQERTGSVVLKPEVSPHTSVEFDLRGSKLTQEHPDGRRTFSGSLSQRGTLESTHPVKDATVTVREGGSRTWSLDIPSGSTGDVDLPLTSSSAQRLPKGASFELTLGSNVGFTGRASHGDTTKGKVDASANSSRNGQVSLYALRGEGDAVRVRVTQRIDSEHGQRAGATKEADGRSMTLGVENTHRYTTAETGMVDLDLSKPDDRALYDQLIAGDLSGLEKRAPLSVERFKNTTTGVNFAVSPNPFVSASVQLRREVYDESDWRSRDTDARRTLADATKAKGQRLEFVEERGVLELSGKTPTTPIGAVGLGFSAGKSLEYTVDRPRIDGQVQGSRWPPLDPKDALEMPAGSRVTIEGANKGEVNLSLSSNTAAARVEASAGASGRSTVKTQAEFLGGGKVRITLDDDSDSKLTFLKLVAEAGVVLPYETANSIAGKLLAKATGLDALSEPRIRFEAEATRTNTERTQLEVTLDLSSPKDAEAYREMMLGNPAKALSLSRGTASYDAGRKDRTAIGVTAFGAGLGVSTERSSETHVTAENGVGRSTNTEAATRDSRFFSQRRSVKFEAVSKHDLGQVDPATLQALAKTSGGKLDDTYFRLVATTNEAFTSAERLNNTRALASGLGLTPDGDQKIEEDKERGLSALLGSGNRFGKTDSSLDVMVSRRGVERLREQSPEAAEAAYSSFFTLANGRTPTWVGPEAAAAKEFLDTYVNATDDDAGYKTWASNQYYSKFKRRLTDDVEDYQKLLSFKKLHQRMQGSTDAREWSRAFADHGADVGQEAFATVHAVNQLASADSVFVNDFTMSGRAVRLKYQARTADSVHARLPPPAVSPQLPTPSVSAPPPVATVAPPPAVAKPPLPPIDVSAFSSASAVRRAADLRIAERLLQDVEARLAQGALDSATAVMLANSLSSLGPLTQLTDELRVRAEAARTVVEQAR